MNCHTVSNKFKNSSQMQSLYSVVILIEHELSGLLVFKQIHIYQQIFVNHLLYLLKAFF